jgi:hypothetical protein
LTREPIPSNESVIATVRPYLGEEPMTHADDESPSVNLNDSDLGLWDAIPVDVGPATPTPVAITPPPIRLRLNSVNEAPEPVSLSVEQSDVGLG